MNKTQLPDLPTLKWVKVLRDPIWQEIPITSIERKLIQTRAFSRLRGIKQLSFAYLAFPGAVHSRFEHSIGVMHATDQLLQKVKHDSEDGRIWIDAYSRQLLRIVALLHDIGHPPFSHAMENLFSYYPSLVEEEDVPLSPNLLSFLDRTKKRPPDLGRHETFTEYIICHDPQISTLLIEWIEEEEAVVVPPVERKGHCIRQLQGVIAKLAVGQYPYREAVAERLRPLLPLFTSIMSGDIDADKIDYLMRDNYFCGLPYQLDLASLRDCLVPRANDLILLPKARAFIHSLVLLRFRLITEVHHNKWDVLATAMAVEMLEKKLRSLPRAHDQIIESVYTKWDDAELVSFLLQEDATAFNTETPHSDHETRSYFQDILTTQYPLKELAQLSYLETHPHIRECVQLLSERECHRYIPVLQKALREDSHREDIYVDILSVKSPEFSLKLEGGGNLLRDEIIRGISEESTKTLHLKVYGREDKGSVLEIDLERLKQLVPEHVPCETCPIGQRCPSNLDIDRVKKYLAQLSVWLYRRISADCGKDKLIGADFLLLVMEKIDEIVRNESPEWHPIRQDIYAVAKLVWHNLPDLDFLGQMDLTQSEITSQFYQEIRKYEQLGLLAFSREIKEMEGEELDESERMVFRFDRRFRLSEFGRFRLDKVRTIEETKLLPLYQDYVRTWEAVGDTLEHLTEDIAAILRPSSGGRNDLESE